MQTLTAQMAYEQEILKEQYSQTLQRLGKPLVDPLADLPKPEPTTQQKAALAATTTTTSTTKTSNDSMEVEIKPESSEPTAEDAMTL